MIDLLYWATPNGHKISLFLEESGLPYRIVPIDITQGAQFAPDFLRVSPNNKIPAIIDHAPTAPGLTSPVTLFESGAILLYLAEKSGRLLPTDPQQRLVALQWLFWQVGGLGPMAGQKSHFANYAPEKVPYALTRYQNETARLYAVLNRQLADRDYIAGAYSIADIACYPWIENYACVGQDIAPYPHLQRWLHRMAQRPAVRRAWAIRVDGTTPGPLQDDAWRRLFAQDATCVAAAAPATGG